MTANRYRPKLEFRFLPRRLMWTLSPKERLANSLSGCGSTAKPSNWEANTLPLSYCRRHKRSSCNLLEVPLQTISVATLFVNSNGWSSLRVVFSQTRKFTVIAFTHANMYATLMAQRDVLKETVPDRMIWSPKPACVIAAVRLSKALKDAHSNEPSNLHVRATRFWNSC